MVLKQYNSVHLNKRPKYFDTIYLFVNSWKVEKLFDFGVNQDESIPTWMTSNTIQILKNPIRKDQIIK